MDGGAVPARPAVGECGAVAFDEDGARPSLVEVNRRAPVLQGVVV